MKFKRTTFKLVTPKSQTEFTQVSFSLGVGFDRLLAAGAKILEKYFGILYIAMTRFVSI